LFTYSVVVADNDKARSAEPVVEVCRAQSSIDIRYCVEPSRNIALARNAAIAHATGDFVAFIDDDEVPIAEWLLRLYQAACVYKADAVLGPVVPRYEITPPRWVLQNRLLDRPRCATGTPLRWRDTRTGNVLLANSVFDGGKTLFRREFRHSEDQDFFQRVIGRGGVVVWCDEAVVHEFQGRDRFCLSYFLKRSLLRGNVSLRLYGNRLGALGKSLLAFSIYTSALPLVAIVSRTLAVRLLIKDCDHIGRLIAGCRIDLQEYLS
jgi:glycosyltransferase involved in cell wall biosynthesis